jgi:hypothetical protein
VWRRYSVVTEQQHDRDRCRNRQQQTSSQVFLVGSLKYSRVTVDTEVIGQFQFPICRLSIQNLLFCGNGARP